MGRERPKAHTTFDISKICGVYPTTVAKWIDKGLLKASVTPGGHRRVSHDELLKFLNKSRKRSTELVEVSTSGTIEYKENMLRHIESKVQERTRELKNEISKNRRQAAAMLNIMENLDESNKSLRKAITKRLKAEMSLKRQLDFERIIAVISARIAVSDDIMRAVTLALRNMARFIGADRAYIFISDTRTGKLSKFSLWKAENAGELTERELRDFSSVAFAQAVKKIRKGILIKTGGIQRLEKLRGVTDDSHKGILIFPMKIKNRSPAFFAMDKFSRERPSHKDDIALLDIFANMLSKAVEQHFLKEERKKYEFMVNAALTMQTLVNRDYIYEAANQAFCSAVGLEHKEIVGRKVNELWGKAAFNNLIKKQIDRCFAGETVNYQDSFALPNQSRAGFFDITMYPYPGGAEKPSHAVVITRDISRMATMEKQFAAQSKLAGIGKLAAGVAHELNNPLTAVITLPDLLTSSAEKRLKSGEIEELAEIKSAGERMKKIVQDLLAFSRPSEKEKKEENINEIIKVAAGLSNPAVKGVTLKLALEEVPDFPLNREKMISLFLNLISNSFDAMAKSPQKKIIVRSEFLKDSGKIVIRLSDTGEGMGGDVLEKIFDPFFTLKETGKGTGLGLSIVHGTVAEHGGKIEVSSAPLKGTEFVLSFPAGRAE